MELLAYSTKDIEDYGSMAESEIHGWKMMIDQFILFKAQNEEEIALLMERPDFYRKENIRKVELLKVFNRSLDEAVDECLDLIHRNQQRIENISQLTQNN